MINFFLILDFSVTSHESGIGALNYDIAVSSAKSVIKISRGKRKIRHFPRKTAIWLENTHLNTERPLHNESFNHHMML